MSLVSHCLSYSFFYLFSLYSLFLTILSSFGRKRHFFNVLFSSRSQANATGISVALVRLFKTRDRASLRIIIEVKSRQLTARTLTQTHLFEAGVCESSLHALQHGEPRAVRVAILQFDNVAQAQDSMIMRCTTQRIRGQFYRTRKMAARSNFQTHECIPRSSRQQKGY